MRALLLCFLLLGVGWGRGQRYADRNPIPADTLPIVDEYDYEATDGYDFKDDRDIFRWNIGDYPHPRDNPRYCNRMKASNVCDPDNVLEKDQADSLDSLIKSLYRETPCICDACQKGDGGIVIGIALLKAVFQPYNEHPSKIIRKFSESLRAKWKLGKCDNDILIVVAVTDRLSYTDVGVRTSSYVSVADAHRIFLENKALLTANHFYEGLRAMLEDYRTSTRTMKKKAAPEPLNVSLIAGALVGAVALLGLLVFVAFVLFRRCRAKDDVKKKQPDDGDASDGVPSSWTKQDIKVLFSSLKSTPPAAQYQPCESEDRDGRKDDDEILDVTLAIPEDNDETRLTTLSAADESPADELDKELDAAAQDIAKTFPALLQPRPRPYNGHMTDL